MTTISDLAPYLTDFEYHGDRWRYEFPNGRVVSVIPDPRQPFRFEVRVDEEEPVRGLTSEQVEAKLSAAYALAAVQPTVALVTVDDRGHLTPESTVTVGEWTWPVPERDRRGRVLWMSRVGQALKEHGWRPSRDWQPMASTLGPNYSEVRVEAIETNEEG